MKRCPLCDREMEHTEAEPDVGITGGWYCTHCDHDEAESLDDFEESDQ